MTRTVAAKCRMESSNARRWSLPSAPLNRRNEERYTVCLEHIVQSREAVIGLCLSSGAALMTLPSLALNGGRWTEWVAAAVFCHGLQGGVTEMIRGAG